MDTISKFSNEISNLFTGDLAFRGAKMADIGYITIIFFVIGIASTMMLNKVFPRFDPEKAKRKSVLQLAVECIVQMFVLGIVLYIARNIVELIPSPLDGVAGLRHKEVKELSGSTVLPFTILWFNNGLLDKVQHLMNRITAGDYYSNGVGEENKGLLTRLTSYDF